MCRHRQIDCLRSLVSLVLFHAYQCVHEGRIENILLHSYTMNFSLIEIIIILAMTATLSGVDMSLYIFCRHQMGASSTHTRILL